MSFRFVHAADLHLDSPFKGIGSVDPALGKTLQQATFRTFENIVSLCLSEAVDALVVAGDVYDGADRSLGAQIAFRDGLLRLADASIRTFVTHGNHDPLDGWGASLDFPDLVHRFGPAVETAALETRDGEHVAIHGFSYPRRVVLENVAANFAADPRADINLGVLHCTVGTQPGHDPYAPCSLADLVAAGMDYWALGHVHERQVLRAAKPAVVYPGNPQGRHLKERGERGVYLVELEPDREPTLDFHAVDAVRWERVQLAIDEMATEQDLLDAMVRSGIQLAAAADGRMVMASICITGEGPLHETLRREGVSTDLTDYANGEFGARDLRVDFTGIEDSTRPAEGLDDGGEFAAEVLREAEALLANPGEEVELALNEILDNVALRSLQRPGEEELMEIVERARVLAIDSLREAAS